MSKPHIEIEKKYIIKKPKISDMQVCDGYSASEIIQTYLLSESGVTRRVRSRESAGKVVYTETKKIRLDNMSAIEDERELSLEEYELLLKNADPASHPIHKVRHVFTYQNQVFEIDVYPEWQNNAILETELDTKEKTVEFPPFIEIISDVTGNRRYSNAAMSRAFPEE